MLSIETIQKRIRDKYGDQVALIVETYTNTHNKAVFIDKDYGKWEASVKTVIKGSRHPKRYHKERILNIKEVKNRIKNIHNNIVSIDDETYKGARSKATFVDKSYGKWNAIVSDVMRGFGHPKRDSDNRRLSLEEFKKKLFSIFGEQVTVVEHTYVKRSQRACFIDKRFGKWWAYPNSLLSGSGHYKNGLLKVNNIYIRYHWKTNKELICQASWEAKVVDYLNQNKINFEWQSKTFEMPNGKKYNPDLFLTDENKWVEIKGYFRRDAKEKWDWFKLQYPNSELWNKEKLEELGIL